MATVNLFGLRIGQAVVRISLLTALYFPRPADTPDAARFVVAKTSPQGASDTAKTGLEALEHSGRSFAAARLDFTMLPPVPSPVPTSLTIHRPRPPLLNRLGHLECGERSAHSARSSSSGLFHCCNAPWGEQRAFQVTGVHTSSRGLPVGATDRPSSIFWQTSAHRHGGMPVRPAPSGSCPRATKTFCVSQLPNESHRSPSRHG